ncbi:MAG: ferritin-like domain-containing protein [Acidimicrobiia bacterium]|nr:ferritin-like domain-containing protein [Acidimicrobiia bacterium]
MAETQTYAEAMKLTDDTVNDAIRILATSQGNVDEIEHAVETGGLTSFTWDYELSRPPLVKLYEKAKSSQWNGTTDLDWSIEVDQLKLAQENAATNLRAQMMREYASKDKTCPLYGWTDSDFDKLSIEFQNWLLSQFLHGEQGALVCTAKIVEQVPWIDAKYYGATQVMDEARHVEVFARYLDSKLSGHYPINVHLEALLDEIIRDSRWDMTYLGMQIMVEGLALAAFGFMHMMTSEPLLKKLLRYVMSDEARHVAFGVLSLKEVYDDMSAAELRERQEFAYEAAVRMRDRFLMQEVWERLGVGAKEMVTWQLQQSNSDDEFTPFLFSKIVPNLKKLGLLDTEDPWLRDRFTEMGAIEFENFVDTGDEYEALDEVAKDRAAS